MWACHWHGHLGSLRLNLFFSLCNSPIESFSCIGKVPSQNYVSNETHQRFYWPIGSITAPAPIHPHQPSLFQLANRHPIVWICCTNRAFPGRHLLFVSSPTFIHRHQQCLSTLSLFHTAAGNWDKNGEKLGDTSTKLDVFAVKIYPPFWNIHLFGSLSYLRFHFYSLASIILPLEVAQNFEPLRIPRSFTIIWLISCMPTGTH